MENHQTSPFDRSNQVFRGIRFVLLGFDPINKAQVSLKLVDSGGVDAGQYGPNCTHVIVDKLVYDDPVCAAARRDGKILVSGLWVEHSFDVGAPVDATSLMYRPVRDLNGIPGAKSLVICLTGYQREEREDIMTMVELMGAQFSKPLIANKVTHLICYQHEGDKYLLAKKMKRIKLINHKWLEDCLRAWEIVSEADYSKSGYELEMEVEAKDSEDEAEGLTTRHNEGEIASPHRSLLLKQEVPRTISNTSASKVFNNVENTLSVTMKSTSDQFSNPHEIKSKHPVAENVIGVTCEPSNPYEGTASGSAALNNINSSSTVANKSPPNEARTVSSASYSRKVPTRTTPPTIETKSNTGSAKRLTKLNFGDAFNMSNSLVEKVDNGSDAAYNGPAFCLQDDQFGSPSGKRKMDITCGSYKLQRMSYNEDTSNRESPHVESVFEELKKDPPAEMSNLLSPGTDIFYLNDQAAISPAQNPPSNTTGRKSLSSKGKNVICDAPISKTPTSEIVESEDFEKLENMIKGFEKSSSSAISSDIQKSSTPNMEISEQNAGTNSKPVKRKSIAKKCSAPNQNLSKKKSVSQKGSIYLNNSQPKNDATTFTADIQGLADDENLFNFQKFEKDPPVAKSGTEMEIEVNDGLQIENMSGNTTLCLDDETEPPEDKEEASKEKNKDGEPENTVNIVMEEKAEEDLHDVDQNNDEDGDITRHGNLISIKNNVSEDKSDDTENLASDKSSRGTKKGKKKTPLSVKEVKDTKVAKKKKLASDDNNEKPEIREEAIPTRAERIKRNLNALEKSMEVKRAEGVCNDREHKLDEKDADMVTENVVNKKETKRSKRPLSKTKKDAALSVKEVPDTKAVNKKGKQSSSRAVKVCDLDAQKENMQIPVDDQSTRNKQDFKSATAFPEKITPKSDKANSDPKWFILSGHQLQRKEYQQIIRRLKGRVCRVSHHWSYQATHFIVPDPVKRVEKFFAAAASGRWILKTDYLSASNQAGKFLAEEPYEWHKNGLSEDGQINLEAPRKWRLLKEKTGHGAFYGMRIIIYGECIAPSLDTLKRVVKSGDGTILATSPPYTRFLNTGIDFAVVSPGMPHVDVWVQEFLRHEIPCISADYLVEYVCKPGYPLDKHVQYDTNVWAERSCNNLKKRLEEETTTEPSTPDNNDAACEVCGSRDRGDEMLICGDESGLAGCGVGTHIDCCHPPLDDVPEEDWFCPKCTKAKNNMTASGNTKKSSKKKRCASRGK